MSRWPVRTIGERLLARVEYDTNGGCWLWGGSTYPSGYGNMGIGQTNYATHRLSWQEFRGPIPDGLWVLHRCDVRPCINPDHLFLGTHRDNTDDMLMKGRGGLKLTPAQVIRIRERRRSESGTALAKAFGVHKTTIYEITKGLTWAHLLPNTEEIEQAIWIANQERRL